MIYDLARGNAVVDETVSLAARWLAEQRDPPQPLLPFLRTRFGITTAEACDVCEKASRMRT
jgi:hypothetical protein